MPRLHEAPPEAGEVGQYQPAARTGWALLDDDAGAVKPGGDWKHFELLNKVEVFSLLQKQIIESMSRHRFHYPVSEHT